MKILLRFFLFIRQLRAMLYVVRSRGDEMELLLEMTAINAFTLFLVKMGATIVMIKI